MIFQPYLSPKRGNFVPYVGNEVANLAMGNLIQKGPKAITGKGQTLFPINP